MSYTARWTERARRDLKQLPAPQRARIITKVTATLAEPHRFFRRLKGRPDYRLRVGDYRVLAEIAPNVQGVTINAIRHRKGAYA